MAAPKLIYDDELGYLYSDPSAPAGIVIVAPPGPPPRTLPNVPTNAPTVTPNLPPDVDERPQEVDDDHAATLELSRWPTAEDMFEELLELAELDAEDEAGRFLLTAADPRIRHGGGVDAHLSRALGCAACSFSGPRDMRGAGRACALRCWQSNNAVDIMAPVGYAVRACADGSVDARLGYGLMSSSGGTAGYRLHVRHASGMLSWYQHMGPKIAARGTRVRRGDIVGYVGRWPSFLPHCHFAVSTPWSPEAFWEIVVSRTGRDRGTTPTPPAPVPAQPAPLTPAEVRDIRTAWLDLVGALGSNRVTQRQRVDAARRAIRDAIR